MKILPHFIGLSIVIFCCQKTTAPIDKKAPAVPTKLEAFGENQSIVIKWDKAQETDIAGHIIYYGTNSGLYTDTLTTDNTNLVKLSGLLDDSQYFIAVSAFDHAGNKSELSSEVTAMTYFAFDDFTQPCDPHHHHDCVDGG